jgi:predicted outer membrane repeat protein
MRKIKYSGTGGGAMMLNTCNLNIQGNASFIRNKAFNGYGGAMLLQNTNSKINGNLNLSKNAAYSGGALSIEEGNFIIKGYTLFDSNSAKDSGGALYIRYAKFKFCGSDYSGNNNVSFDSGALPLNKAKAFDTECSTDNALSLNNSITFLLNTAGYGGGSILCESVAIMFIGMVYFNESYDNAVEGYGCNMTFVGTTCFHRNSANQYGGGVLSIDGNIIFSGTAYFEGNVANSSGGAIALQASKLIFKPNINIFFISNYANETGGALYIIDTQCSLGSSVPIECFFTIDGPSTSTSNISLHFENNIAGTTGSILYGGQLDQCTVFFKSPTTNYKEPDPCGYSCQAHGYSDNALETFLNMSNVTQNEDNVLTIIIFNSKGNHIL